jgi:hypothetical protein
MPTEINHMLSRYLIYQNMDINVILNRILSTSCARVWILSTNCMGKSSIHELIVLIGINKNIPVIASMHGYLIYQYLEMKQKLNAKLIKLHQARYNIPKLLPH